MSKRVFHYQRTSKRRRKDGIYIPFNGHTIFVPEEHIILKTIVAEALIRKEITQDDEEVQQLAKLLQVAVRN